MEGSGSNFRGMATGCRQSLNFAPRKAGKGVAQVVDKQSTSWYLKGGRSGESWAVRVPMQLVRKFFF